VKVAREAVDVVASPRATRLGRGPQPRRVREEGRLIPRARGWLAPCYVEGAMTPVEPLQPVDFAFTCEQGPLGAWRVASFNLHEALSAPYRLVLELLREDQGESLDALLGASCALGLERAGRRRVVAGIVRAYTVISEEEGQIGVRVEVGPALALLGQGSDSRIWQGKSVPELVREIVEAPLAAYGRELRFDLDLADYPPREHCVQHRESDLEFITRILAEEGIFFRFEHDDAAELLVLTDDVRSCPSLDCTGEEELPRALPFIAKSTASRAMEAIEALSYERSLVCTAVRRRTWSWRSASEPACEEEREGAERRGHPRFIYEHAEHAEDLPGHRARRSLERESASSERSRGRSDAIGIAAGWHLAVSGHQRVGDRGLLVVSVITRGEAPDSQLGAVEALAPRLIVDFEALPKGIPFRPPVPPRPQMRSQTAVVVGPPGEEIHTDEFGRVQVRFHWDRSEPADAPSCWLRVSQISAGAGYGALFLPRVGAEVIIEFLDGDPDRPVVTGALFNAHNRPPFPLPAKKTRSVIRSDSSPGGGGYNEISFEDRRGGEVLSIRAERDLRERIGNNHHRRVGGDATVEIAGQKIEGIASHSLRTIGETEHVIIERGDQTVEVLEGSLDTTVAKNWSHEVSGGDATMSVIKGRYAIAAYAGVEIASAQGGISLTAKGCLLTRSVEGLTTICGDPGVELKSSRGSVQVSVFEKISMRAEVGAVEIDTCTDFEVTCATGNIRLFAPGEIKSESLSEINVEAPTINITASESIVLKVGASEIRISAEGIEVKGPTISSTATMTNTVAGKTVRLN
jgi:type VI secretion system secreted protein VgrG